MIAACPPGTYGNDEETCSPCPESCGYPCNNYYGCRSRVTLIIEIKICFMLSSRKVWLSEQIFCMLMMILFDGIQFLTLLINI